MPEAWQFSSLQPACKGPPLPDRYLGRSLGKYQVTRLLGAGAFAWVYEAVDRDLEIPVALKVLRPEYAGLPGAEARFRKEATTAARLRHPNIVTVRDVGSADGTVFVAMDLLPLSLARRLEVLPRLPETEVVRFALDVAAALSIAHADGVVHRDIKPDNVLIGSNGEAVVADFGLAGVFAGNVKGDMSRSPTNEVLGTPHYFSPEQARGLEMDGRADLYALGVMCYRAATGKLPFEGDDWYVVARQHIEDAPVPPRALVPELNEGFDAIVLRLMAKDPHDRFSSATQLADALLMLPTAPIARGVSFASSAVTQIASPYAQGQAKRAKHSGFRRIAYLALGVAALAVIGVFALPSTGEYSLQSLLQSAPPVPVIRHDDSLIVIPRDTTVPKGDSAIALVAPLKPATRSRPISPPAPKAHIEVSTSDSAQLWINEVLMDHNRWSGDLLTGQKQHFRALLRGNPEGCTSARRDTVLVFNAVRPENVNLDVAPCGILLLTIKSQDADFTLTGRDFETSISGKYTGQPIPVVLRYGRYGLRVRMERCNPYDDSVRVMPDSLKANTIPRVVTPYCN